MQKQKNSTSKINVHKQAKKPTKKPSSYQQTDCFVRFLFPSNGSTIFIIRYQDVIKSYRTRVISFSSLRMNSRCMVWSTSPVAFHPPLLQASVDPPLLLFVHVQGFSLSKCTNCHLPPSWIGLILYVVFPSLSITINGPFQGWWNFLQRPGGTAGEKSHT